MFAFKLESNAAKSTTGQEQSFLALEKHEQVLIF